MNIPKLKRPNKLTFQRFCFELASAIKADKWEHNIGDAIRGRGFYQKVGLCGNYAWWLRGNGYEERVGCERLDKIFKGSGYPFNASHAEYSDEHRFNIIYRNKKRLSFIRKHAREYVKRHNKKLP